MTHMAHRLPITLSDRQYDVLKKTSSERHSSIAELIRRAVDAAYLADASLADDLKRLEGGLGVWKRPSTFDPTKRVKELRKPLGPRPKQR